MISCEASPASRANNVIRITLNHRFSEKKLKRKKKKQQKKKKKGNTTTTTLLDPRHEKTYLRQNANCSKNGCALYPAHTGSLFNTLTLLHSERPKLYGVLAVLSARVKRKKKVVDFGNSIEPDEVASLT